MVLLDSNVVIYAVEPARQPLRDWLRANQPLHIASVTRIEVLGFKRITPANITAFEGFFATAETIPLGEDIVAEAIRLRQVRRLKLGDAIIAATALTHPAARHAQHRRFRRHPESAPHRPTRPVSVFYSPLQGRALRSPAPRAKQGHFFCDGTFNSASNRGSPRSGSHTGW